MSGTTDEPELLELYHRWARAVAERDRGALESLFAPDYAYTSPEGERLTREQILDAEMEVPPPGLPFTAFAVQRVAEDVVVARGRHTLKGELPAHLVRPELLEQVRRGVEIAFTSVWRRSADGWRVVSNDAHVVPLD
jgi:ketosteroid isomerase-like protein